MRTGCLLLLALGSGVISLSTPGCGGQTTNAETNYYRSDAATTTTGTGGSDNTGAGGGGGTGATGGGSGSGGTDDPIPPGTTGTGSGGTTGGTGGSGPGDPGGSGATGGTGATGGAGGSGATGGTGGSGGAVDPPRIDASTPGCPEMQPMNNSTCSEVAVSCSYGNTICACMNSGGGGGGNRRDAGMTTWNCNAAPTDAGRGGRG